MVLNFNENVKDSVLVELGLRNSFHKRIITKLLKNEQDLISWLEDSGLTDKLVYVVENEQEKSSHVNLSELDKVILIEDYKLLEKYLNDEDYFILYVDGKKCFYYVDRTKVDDMLVDKYFNKFTLFMNGFKKSNFYHCNCDNNFISISLDFCGNKVSTEDEFYNKIYYKFFESAFGIGMKDDVIYRPHYDSNNNLISLTVDLSYVDYNIENVENVQKVIKKMFFSYESCDYTSFDFEVLRAGFSKPAYEFLPHTASFSIYSYNG